MSRESSKAIGQVEVVAATSTRARHGLPALRIAVAAGALLVVVGLVVTRIMPLLVVWMMILPINCLWLYRILRPAQGEAKR